jgi:hypothetical protein
MLIDIALHIPPLHKGGRSHKLPALNRFSVMMKNKKSKAPQEVAKR